MVPVFFLNLGSIHLGGDLGELDIDITLPTQDVTGETTYTPGVGGSPWYVGASEALEVYAVSHSMSPDQMLQYTPSTKDEETYHNVESIFLVNVNAGDSLVTQGIAASSLVYPDVEFQIEDGDSTSLTPLAGIMAASMVFGEQAGFTHEAYLAYKSPDALPSSVFFKKTGAGASTIKVLVRELRWPHRPNPSNLIRVMPAKGRELFQRVSAIRSA